MAGGVSSIGGERIPTPGYAVFQREALNGDRPHSPVPLLDSDPTEVAVLLLVLTGSGHDVVFATPDGTPARCDVIMLRVRV